MKRYVFLIAACLAVCAPQMAQAFPATMVHIKGVDGMVPMYMSEDDMLADGGYKASNSVFHYKGVVYVEVDYNHREYVADCCIDGPPS